MKTYRLRHLKSNSIQTLDDDQYQELKGRGWLSRYAIEEVTVNEIKSHRFQPPQDIIRLSAPKPIAVFAKEDEPIVKKRGRPKKEVNAQ